MTMLVFHFEQCSHIHLCCSYSMTHFPECPLMSLKMHGQLVEIALLCLMMQMVIMTNKAGDDQHCDAKLNPARVDHSVNFTARSWRATARVATPTAIGTLYAAVSPAMVARQQEKC